MDRMRRVEDNKGCIYVVGVLIRWTLLGLILFIALNLLLAIFGTGGITYAQALVAAIVLDNLFNILRFFFH